MITREAAERLSKTLQRVLAGGELVAPEGGDTEASNALRSLKTALANRGVNLTDVKLAATAGDELENLFILYSRRGEEIDRLRREVNFFRRTCDPAMINKAERAGEIDNRFDEFLDLVSAWLGDGSVLPKYWRKPVTEALAISPRQFDRWESGRELIPDEIFDKLREVMATVVPAKANAKPSRPAKTPKPPRETGPKADAYDWPGNIGVETLVVSAFMRGKGPEEILRMATAKFPDQPLPNVNQIRAKTYNSPPPAWVSATVKTEGPAEWKELWLIGAALRERRSDSWRGMVWSRIIGDDPKMSDGFVPISDADLAELRAAYFEKIKADAERLAQKASRAARGSRPKKPRGPLGDRSGEAAVERLCKVLDFFWEHGPMSNSEAETRARELGVELAPGGGFRTDRARLSSTRFLMPAGPCGSGMRFKAVKTAAQLREFSRKTAVQPEPELAVA